MSRKLARELSMKVLFEMHINNDFDLKKADHHIFEGSIEEKQRDYIYDVLNGVIVNLTDIDRVIEEYSKGWKLNRIANVDLAILRLAFAEILYMKDIPYRVSINEAVELAKLYGSDETPSFINGILGKYVEKAGLKEDE
ncbi:transcription antitermination factor NusB [Alkaliphilus sp. MSJ-5]|uniref:Transcription antitermination protein NusB n=1 Tax=Alkaliphilus flagellatus TaxID=2841507 RepID=A0ABS6G808_9FIRM|nr:transcription antitermination factor NusB [Alkaliphilus flagellatus]MBU5677565.1 transcription antitermination factor NusB [Alkaliphilus flagellatus]